MDLDRFKDVNDHNGHRAGDQLLREIAIVLARLVRERDTLARLGGDEFALLMEHCRAGEAVKTGRMLVRTSRQHQFEWQGSKLPIGISVDMVVIDRHSGDAVEMLEQADRACYRAKNDTVHKIQLHNPTQEYSEIDTCQGFAPPRVRSADLTGRLSAGASQSEVKA